MKTELKKKATGPNSIKTPSIIIDPALNKYADQVMFPEKLALAKEQLKNVKLPSREELLKLK